MASNIKPDLSFDCPACIAKDPEVEHLKPLDTKDLSVTVQSSGKTLSFEEATKTYLQDHYSDLSCNTYRVPAAFYYYKSGNLDLKTNDEVSEGEVAKRFQREAVEKVVQRFYSWGCKHGEGILVLSEYDMRNYLKGVKAGSKKRKTINGEHDVMVIKLNTVVTFVQVKSTGVKSDKITSKETTMHSQTQTAFKQVAKDEKAFREMNADLDFISTVPVVCFVALPNMTRDHLSEIGMCNDHKGQVLTSEDLESPTEFNKRVGKCFKAEESLGLENYKELCGRYIGLASHVRIRTLPDAIEKTSAKVGKILLTPEQREMISVDNRRQVIFGNYGTGKSLILAKMAEKIVTSGEELQGIVFVVSCTSINLDRAFEAESSEQSRFGFLLSSPSHLVSHLPNLFSKKMSPFIKIMSIADLVIYCFPDTDPYSERFSPALMAKLTRGVLSKHPNAHIMWDEVPFVLTPDWTLLKDLCKQYPRTFVWVSASLVTYIGRDASDFKKSVEHELKPNFNVTLLNRCMRMTRKGFQLHQALKSHYWNPTLCPFARGNAVDGSDPQWYPLQKCSCGNTDLLRCTCFESQFTNTLERIWGLLLNIDPSHVSFIIGERKDNINRFLKDSVIKACQTLHIPVDALPTSDDDNHSTQETSEDVAPGSTCRIMDSVSCRGCESPVVIIVIEDDLRIDFRDRYGYARRDHLQMMISRALDKIFIITLPQQDIDTLVEDYPPNCEPNCADLLSQNLIVKCKFY
ncbi:uncharacterized protein LOC117291589 [Asterias rubens]|uniref:uncharacterized protein LOC117291589 n=1 Tax=Asterias rubens TaxID=7604 RepID=UPI00145564D0|nr:uncharacterized protein LOC117291589 [Asterias rubens]